MFMRLVTTVMGVVLLVYGIIAALSPLPAGVPLIVLGLVMIAAANPAARPLIRKLRRRWRWFDKLVAAAGRYGPKNLKSTIDETKPEGSAENEEQGNV